MPDDILPPTASSQADLGSTEHEPSGDSGDNGVADHDQGDGGADETSASSQRSPDPDNSKTDDDDGADLIEALASGKMDDLDAKGAKKSEAKPKEDEKPAEKPADPVADKQPDPAKELTAEEQAEIAAAPKGQRQGLKKLLTERRELRTQIEAKAAEVKSYEPVKKFADDIIADIDGAGLLRKNAEGHTDFTVFKHVIAEQKMLSKMNPKDAAEYYRDLANKIHPDSMPVKLSEDLSNQVEAGFIKQEEAELIERRRLESAKPKPSQDEMRRQAEANAAKERTQAESVTRQKQEADTALGEIGKLCQPYKAKFGAEWEGLASDVQKRLGPLTKGVPPSSWPALAETVIQLVISERRRSNPLKKPTQTPTPNQPKQRAINEVPTEEEDIAALASGRF